MPSPDFLEYLLNNPEKAKKYNISIEEYKDFLLKKSNDTTRQLSLEILRWR